jgi:hypothetical protein
MVIATIELGKNSYSARSTIECADVSITSCNPNCTFEPKYRGSPALRLLELARGETETHNLTGGGNGKLVTPIFALER